MAGDSTNPGKDLLKIVKYDGDRLIDDKVEHRYGMLISRRYGLAIPQQRPIPVFEQYSVNMPPIRTHSVLRISEDATPMEHGDGWEYRKVLPSASYDEEARGGLGAIHQAWAQTILFIVGVIALAWAGWTTYDNSRQPEEPQQQQQETVQTPVPIEQELDAPPEPVSFQLTAHDVAAKETT